MKKNFELRINSFIRKGFTLVEVLIALVIILTVIATSTMVYTNAQRSSMHAENITRILASLPVVLDTVRSQIRKNPTNKISGDGALMGVTYQWEANVIESKPPPPQLIVENDEVVAFSPRFSLYQVTLSLSFGGRLQQYQYEELAWAEFSVAK